MYVYYYLLVVSNIALLGLKPGSCPPNMARCGNSTKCEYIEVFCDGTSHCENSTDEGTFCGKLFFNLWKFVFHK